MPSSPGDIVFCVLVFALVVHSLFVVPRRCIIGTTSCQGVKFACRVSSGAFSPFNKSSQVKSSHRFMGNNQARPRPEDTNGDEDGDVDDPAPTGAAPLLSGTTEYYPETLGRLEGSA